MVCGCCSWLRGAPYQDFEEENGGSRSAQAAAPPPQMMGKAEGSVGSHVKVPADVLKKKLEQSKQTRVLALRECGLKTLPKGSVDGEMVVLRIVDVGVNKLSSLPDDITVWSNLQKLQCERNELTALPSGIDQLAALEQLVVSKNRLRTLPASIGNLGKLKMFLVDGNALGPKLPDVFWGTIASSLEELNLADNGLEELAPTLSQLGALVNLSLAGNKLKELPESLGQLRNLSRLDASQNALSRVPASLFENTRLAELELRGNPMDRLQLQAMPGFEHFLERRKAKLDAKISSNVVGKVDLSMCGLD